MADSGFPDPSPGAAHHGAGSAPSAERGDSRRTAALEPIRYDAARGELPPFPRFDDEDLPAAGPSAPAGGPAPQAQAQASWALRLPDGRELPVDAPVIVGRNPSADQFPHVAVRALNDPTRTMSKTHARFAVEHGALLVEDLNSTNGVAHLPAGESARAATIEPGRTVEVRDGDVVQLGEYPLVVRRA